MSVALTLVLLSGAAVAPVQGADGGAPGARPAAKPPATATSATAPPVNASSRCAQDEPVPAPRGWLGWDRSSTVVWEAVEQGGGVVPEIEEDRTQSPPAWWRYPSALRSEALLDLESRDATVGLYRRVEGRELARGDILIRTAGDGVGACGKMAVVDGDSEGKWVTTEGDPGLASRDPVHRTASPLFFAADGKTLLPRTRVFRIRVKKEETIGHIRELRRDLDHLERTVGDRPPLLARGDGADEVVAEKVHELIDEAWSLVAEEAYDVDRRELAGRAFVLGAALGWPGAAESAIALLDDVLRRAPTRVDALGARAMIAELAGDAPRALADARAAIAIDPTRPRARWAELRALRTAGRNVEAEDALRRFRALDPRDVRAAQLSERWRVGAEASPDGGARAPVRGAATVASAPSGDRPSSLRYFATPERTGFSSDDPALQISWPLTWRMAQLASAPETGLVATLTTGRVLLDDGRADRASAVILAQRPAGAAARATLLRSGVRKMFPTAKLKSLPPLVAGSRRDSFLDKQAEGQQRAGEVVTIEKGGLVVFLVFNAPAEVYPKLRDEYASFVGSLVLGSRSSSAPEPATSTTHPATPAP